jgi:hypothetical protein
MEEARGVVFAAVYFAVAWFSTTRVTKAESHSHTSIAPGGARSSAFPRSNRTDPR